MQSAAGDSWAEGFKGWVFLDYWPFQVLAPRQFAPVCRSVNVEWGFNENRVAGIVRQERGKSDSQIFKFSKAGNLAKFRLSGN